MKKIFFVLTLSLLLLITACGRKELTKYTFHIDGTLYENCTNKPYSNQNVELIVGNVGNSFNFEKPAKIIQTDALGHFSFSDTVSNMEKRKDISTPYMEVHIPQDSIRFRFTDKVDIHAFEFVVKDALHQRLYFQGKSSYSDLDTLFYQYKNDPDIIYSVPANQQNVLLQDIAMPTYALDYDVNDKRFYSSIYYAVGRIKLFSAPNLLNFHYYSCSGVQNDTLVLE